MIIVTADPKRKMVRAVMKGLLTVDEVAQFSREEQAAVQGMGLESGEFVLLIETLGSQIQTQEVMDAFRKLLVGSSCKAARIATVRTGVLNQMQSRRVSQARTDAEVFATVAEAEEWLFAPTHL